MTRHRMTREERDRGLDATGDEALAYYRQAMAEAMEILEAGRKGYLPHLCRERNPQCWRCELNLDELEDQ